jgi:hypothetical protein
MNIFVQDFSMWQTLGTLILLNIMHNNQSQNLKVALACWQHHRPANLLHWTSLNPFPPYPNFTAQLHVQLQSSLIALKGPECFSGASADVQPEQTSHL